MNRAIALTPDHRAGSPRLTPDVVPGVHRIEHAFTNCYLLTDGDAWTLVDAAFPHTWSPLIRAAHELDLRMRDLQGIVLTHGHFDHVGVAARAVEELGVPVFVHAGDRISRPTLTGTAASARRSSIPCCIRGRSYRWPAWSGRAPSA